MSKSTIKNIISPVQPWFAAYGPDEESDIGSRIVPVVCWSIVTDDDGDDVIVGQIVAGDAVCEATVVDEEEGFGPFVGYFQSEELAKLGIEEAAESETDGDDEAEDEDEDEDDDDDEDDEDEDG